LKILKNNDFDEIKQEILNSEVDNWFVEQKNESSAQNFDFEIKRKNDKMLKEFGW